MCVVALLLVSYSVYRINPLTIADRRESQDTIRALQNIKSEIEFSKREEKGLPTTLEEINNYHRTEEKDGIERFVVGAVIVDAESILFVRRAQDDFMGGIYELPSGKVDTGESLIEALKREILEETNLTINNIIDLCDTFDYKSKSGIQTRQFNFVVSVSNIDTLKLDPKEHDLSEWVKFEDIESSKILDDMMKSIAQKAVVRVKKIGS